MPVGPRTETPRTAAGGLIGEADPRAKILSVLAVMIIITSGPRTGVEVLMLDLVMISFFAAASGVPVRDLLRSVGRASPFIVAAALLFPLSQAGAGPSVPDLWRRAIVIALKAYASVTALTLLVMTDRPDRLLGAARSLGLPAGLASIMALAGRFLRVLGDEVARMKRARESRTPGRLRVSRILVFGRLAGALFLRAWKRAGSVQAALEARGFRGLFPVLDPPRFRRRDALAAAVFTMPFAAVRILLS